MKQLTLGILAHVDAGKTTLSEAMLHLAGVVGQAGRVDHGNAFLDTDALERARGITIFSKQAVLPLGNTTVTLLDTPGHVDFSAEMERTLQVLDCAILVINGSDGVQAHTRTLWRLLRHHQVPTLLFVNKTDLAGVDRAALLAALKAQLSDGITDFGDAPALLAENLALCDAALLARYLEGAALTDADIASLVARRRVFPCYFGAALRLDGVGELLDGLARFAPRPTYPAAFGAKVFKISRDEQGSRLTHLKITGGSLKVKTLLASRDAEGWQDKVDQIRIYSGAKYRTVDEAPAGTVCAVTGLAAAVAGEGLGHEPCSEQPALEPVLTYRALPPEGCDARTLLSYLRQLEEEDPLLRVRWDETLGEAHVCLMGEVQLEVLTHLLETRFGAAVSFDAGGIVYLETISAPVIGIGHFEPLRHYAEVHLLLEPAARGSGLSFDTACSGDVLEPSWQRLVLTHLAEKPHTGVLTGAAVTDLHITLLTGRAHVKHTEGGDFRQATYRAVRQGLMQAESVLLEPYYEFRLQAPSETVGRVMTDLQRMGGTLQPPEAAGGYTVLCGRAPVAALRGYHREVASYTRGQGQLSCTLAGYAPCHNADEVIAAIGYDAERDTNAPADSVFCSHGAGYNVKWHEVAAHAHLASGVAQTPQADAPPPRASASSNSASDEELEALFVRTYGPIKNRGFEAFRGASRPRQLPDASYLPRGREDDYLLVDGYNIIFAWDELAAIAKGDLEAARAALINILSNYQGLRKCRLILVFDAYRVKGGTGSSERQFGIDVVYTKEAETADMYIERLSYDLSRRHRVRVATSDALEQIIILGHGAARVSANDLKWEVEQTDEHLAALIRALQ